MLAEEALARILSTSCEAHWGLKFPQESNKHHFCSHFLGQTKQVILPSLMSMGFKYIILPPGETQGPQPGEQKIIEPYYKVAQSVL
jgi:hypothetical protein